MHRFGEQFEFRVDRRQVFLLFLGGLFWTMLAFFLGMMAAGRDTIPKNLSALGWWHPQSRAEPLPRSAVTPERAQIRFSFADPSRKRSPTPRSRRRAVPVASAPPTLRLRSSTPNRRRPAPRPRARSQARRRPRHRVVPRPPAPRVRVARKASPSLEGGVTSLLQEARAFRSQLERTKAQRAELTSVPRACRVQVDWKRARYTIRLRVTGAKVLRLRRALGQQGYPVRTVLRRVQRRRVYQLELGRYTSRRQAAQCLRPFQRRHRIGGQIVRVKR